MSLRKAFRNKLKTKPAGLTMIELLMVVAVMSLLTSMGVVAYRNWQQHVLLVNAVDELKSGLALAQQQAIAASQGTNWGVHLATSSYVLFPGSFYDENNPANKSRDFNGVSILNLNTAIADGAGGFSPNVVFSRYTGQTPNVGSLILAPNSLPTHIRTINVAATGQVN